MKAQKTIHATNFMNHALAQIILAIFVFSIATSASAITRLTLTNNTSDTVCMQGQHDDSYNMRKCNADAWDHCAIDLIGGADRTWYITVDLNRCVKSRQQLCALTLNSGTDIGITLNYTETGHQCSPPTQQP